MKDLLDELPTDVEGSPASLMHLPQTDPYEGLSKLGATLTTAQREILLRDTTTDQLDVLPTGEVYQQQTHYRHTLVEAFGPGGWGMKPLGPLTMKDDVLFREWMLEINGYPIGSAVGKAEYREDNVRADIADAAETVKSNALMRCCKDLGLAWKCWDKRFQERYRREHCVQVFVVKKNARNGAPPELQWRRTDADPLLGEVPPAVSGQPKTVDVQQAQPAQTTAKATGPIDVQAVSVKNAPGTTGAALTTTKKPVVLYPSDVFAAGQQAGWATKYLNAVITERMGKSVTALKPGDECVTAIAIVQEVRGRE